MITWPCRGVWNDTFFRSPSSTFEIFSTKTNNKCLNVSGGVAPNPVISWTCGSFENERFKTMGVEWRAMGNMCVEAVNNALELRNCNNSAAQTGILHILGLPGCGRTKSARTAPENA